MSYFLKVVILVFGLFSLISCEKEVKFAFELDHLLNTRWGIPQIIEQGPGVTDIDFSAPTVFYADGTMSIGGSNFDLWSLRSSRTILLEQRQELWLIISLSPTQLMVEKSRFPTGQFLLRCVYHPME